MMLSSALGTVARPVVRGNITHATHAVPKAGRFQNKRHTHGSSYTSLQSRFWNWTTQARPSWKENKLEAAVVFCVFGVTGSTSVGLVRPALKYTIGLEGSFIEGPNSYR